jgi:hypothetical protein
LRLRQNSKRSGGSKINTANGINGMKNCILITHRSTQLRLIELPNTYCDEKKKSFHKLKLKTKAEVVASAFAINLLNVTA